MSRETGDSAMWGGRFEEKPSDVFREANDSLAFDWALVQQDITGSIAWAHALRRAGVLTHEEAGLLEQGLRTLASEAETLCKPPVESGAEDVHSWVEQRLIESLGSLGKKLHTGRSRNDQVATDLRLWCREAIDERVAELDALLAAVLRFAQTNMGAVMPGYTHLQRAQPVLVSHWAMAYAAMLERDRTRLTDARRRVNECPLGCAALAGTAYPIDRDQVAHDLGFSGPTANSLDTVGDRDFALETLAALAICAMHLSRMGEEMLIFGSAEFGFFRFGEAVASGSSIMPQKKNPDAAELMRGKAGRVAGDFVALLTTLKGLPMAYNKDLQEDKEPLFDAMRHVSRSLRLARAVIDATRVDAERCRAAAAGSYTNATELADYLVGQGVAFRDAHHQVGRIVRDAIEQGVDLQDLSLDQLRAHAPATNGNVYEALTLEASLVRRDVIGGTAPERVSAAMQALQNRLDANAEARTIRH